MIIGIGGVSNAGKTTLAKKLKEHLSCFSISTICQDDFPNAIDQIPKIRNHVDWEIPESIDLSKFYKKMLSDDKEYDIVIAEGLFAFCNNKFVQHYDKKIFITLTKDTFRKRKQKDLRWGKEPEWYIEHIWESHFRCGTLTSFDENTLIISGENTIDINKILDFLNIPKRTFPKKNKNIPVLTNK